MSTRPRGVLQQVIRDADSAKAGQVDFVEKGERLRKELEHVRRRKLSPAEWALENLAYLEAHRAMGEVVTGLLYVEDEPLDLHDAQNTVDVPLNALSDADLVPGAAALAAFNAKLA